MAKTDRVKSRCPDSGLLATNHLNLFYMLSAGLLLPPAGFGGKHYHDTLDSFPGWIPLFLGRPSRRAISESTAEAPHLKPVLVEGIAHGHIRSGLGMPIRSDGGSRLPGADERFGGLAPHPGAVAHLSNQVHRLPIGRRQHGHAKRMPGTTATYPSKTSREDRARLRSQGLGTCAGHHSAARKNVRFRYKRLSRRGVPWRCCCTSAIWVTWPWRVAARRSILTDRPSHVRTAFRMESESG